jgi:hypothetical protein
MRMHMLPSQLIIPNPCMLLSNHHGRRTNSSGSSSRVLMMCIQASGSTRHPVSLHHVHVLLPLQVRLLLLLNLLHVGHAVLHLHLLMLSHYLHLLLLKLLLPQQFLLLLLLVVGAAAVSTH